MGIEAYHRDDNCEILDKGGITKVGGSYAHYYKYGHITLHCKNQKAYEALVKLVSDRDLTAEKHGSERKPLFTWADLEYLGSFDITMTSGCLIGMVSKHVMNERFDLATQYYEKLRSIPKAGNFYVEQFCHRCDKNWVNGVFIDLEGGEKLKFYNGKKLKTDTEEEISAIDLSKLIKKGKNVGRLLAIKSYKTWEEVKPRQILNAVAVQDFIQNECKPHCPDGDVQLTSNKFTRELALKYGDPMIVSDDAHYAYKEEKIIQEAKLGGMGDNFRFYGDYHRHSSEEVAAYFTKYMGLSFKEVEQIIDNNINWSKQFKDFKFENKISLPVSFYPKDTLSHFKSLIDKHGRMDWNNPSMVERLKSEINLLHNNGTVDLLPYFFLGEEIPYLYEQNGKLTGPGRGSAAGLLTSYLLGITHVDPLKYNLSQDRFLTVDRIKTGKMPDIDQDLPDRDILFPYLEKRFGDRVARISTNQQLRVRNSIKDVARATWGSVPAEIEALCASIPNPPQGIEDHNFIFGYEGDDGKEVRGLLEEHKGLQEYVKKYPKQWEIVLKLLGIMRAKGKHASAVIIADKPVDSFIPLMTVADGRCTQYTMGACEASGALKMDYLCLNTLKDIEAALKIIQENSGIKLDDNYRLNGKRVPKLRVVPVNGELYDVYDLPEDQDVFRSICEGETETVFQFSTHSAQKWLKEFDYIKDEALGTKAIDSIEAMSAFTALDRPGPLDAPVEENGIKRNMLQEYASRARGAKPIGMIDFMSEQLTGTYGVMVYQEQLTFIYQTLTGCSGVDANKFREDISKKRMEKVLARYNGFMEAASAKIGQEDAKRVWDQIFTFGQYGFNKSHSVSYSIIAYACAFLKYHFPKEWWCAVLRNADKKEIGEKFWKYCNKYVDLPDMKSSGEQFIIKDSRIVAPLNILIGLGETAHKEILKNLPYTDLSDFCQKIAQQKAKNSKVVEGGKIRQGVSALNSGVVNKLIVSGVMDSLFPSGMDMLSKLEMYQTSLARALNKKKPEKVNEKYINLNQLDIYQHRKSILPIYSNELLSHLHNLRTDGVNKKTVTLPKATLEFYNYSPENPKTIGHIMAQMDLKRMWDKPFTFLNGKLFSQLNREASIPEGKSLKVAVAAYVEKFTEWQYKDKKTGQMLTGYKFVLDIDGESHEIVKWPNYFTKENKLFDSNLEGGIIVAVLSKRKEYNPFTIEAVVLVKPPLEE